MMTKRTITATALALTTLLAVPALAAEPSTEAPAKAPVSFSILDYGSGQPLTEEEGIALALEHAGFTQDDAERQRTDYDRDDGLEILEVEFLVDGDEYDYEIDQNGGRILSASYDMSDRKQYDLPLLSSPLSDSEAADLILDRVPGSTDNDLWIEADRDDGRMYYEIELTLEDVEYSFDIDAESGEIVSWDQELTDRILYSGNGSTGRNERSYHYEEEHHDDRYDD